MGRDRAVSIGQDRIDQDGQFRTVMYYQYGVRSRGTMNGRGGCG